jgi:hypothetical protein
MIKCHHCGTLNSIDRFLCLSCGKKLNLTDSNFIVSESASPAEIKKSSQGIRLEKDGIFEGLFFKSTIGLFLILVYLMSYTGHMPQLEPTLTDIQSLDKKLSQISKSRDYLTLNEVEANIFIERHFFVLRDKLKQVYPRFFSFQKLILQPGKSDLTIHCIFSFFKKPLDLTLYGTLSLKNNQWTYPVHQARFGKMIFPRFLALFLSRPLYSLWKTEKLTEKLPPLSQVKIENRQFFLFPLLSSGSDSTKAASPSSMNSSLPEAAPDDLLLIQAGDSFFTRNQFKLAMKYYQLSLLKVPHSPLSDYINKQIRLCQDQLQG